MKKKFFVLLASLASSLLPSCSDTLNPNKTTIDMNGDIGQGLHYEDVCAETDANSILNRVENGEKIALLLESVECSHCLKMQDAFVDSIKDLRFEINLISYDGIENHYVDFANNVYKLQKRYGNDEKNGGIAGATPSFYILDHEKATYIGDINSSATIGKITSALKREFASSGVYHFASFEKMEAFCVDNDVISYLNNSINYSDFYYETIRPAIINSNKKMACFDYLKAKEEDKEKALDFFGIESPKEIIKLINPIDIANDRQSAIDLIDEYVN